VPEIKDDSPRKPGWWLSHPSEKYEFVSWDDFPFPTEWKNHPNVPNHQAEAVKSVPQL